MDRAPHPSKHANDPFTLPERASKRRKLDRDKQANFSDRAAGASGSAETKDEWDDSLELTQADLETLDVMASQAIIEAEGGTSPAYKNNQSTMQATEMPFLVPSHPVHLSKRQSSSSSDSSSLRPVSISSRSFSDTNGSLSSHSSSNGTADHSEIVKTLQTKLEQETKRAQEEKYCFAGEIKFLRESLHKQEEELEKLRSVRDDLMDQQKKEQTEKEQGLLSKLKSLTSQAQFKEKEFQDLQAEYHTLQLKVKKLQQEKQSVQYEESEQLTQEKEPTKTLVSSQASQHLSPRKVKVKASPPPKKVKRDTPVSPSISTFPTKSSFMEQTSGASSSNLNAKTMTSSTAASSLSCPACKSNVCSNIEMPKVTQKKSRRLKLNVSPRNASLATSRIVKHLLRSSTFKGGSIIGPDAPQEYWDPGLSGLLHTMCTSLSITNLTYRRVKDSTILTPLKPKTHSMRRTEEKDNLEVVSRDQLNMAIEGLCRLIDEREGQEITSETTKNSSPEKSGALLLLPLLSEYVHHYVDLLSSSTSYRGGGGAHSQAVLGCVDFGASSVTPNRDGIATLIKPSRDVSPRSGSFPSYSVASLSSCESSLDSLSSCVIQLLQDGRLYASNLEGYALTSLRCLALLIHMCPAVGQAIIESSDQCIGRIQVNTSTTEASTSSSNMEENITRKDLSASGVDADDEKSESSSEIRVVVGICDYSGLSPLRAHTQRNRPSLLQRLLSIASQDLEETNYSQAMVSQSLAVMTVLSKICKEEDYYKLDAIINRGVLSNCLQHSTHCDVIVWSLRLLSSLSRHEKLFIRLCTNSEKCPFFIMHGIFSRSACEKKRRDSDLEKRLIEYILCMSSVVAQHRQSLSKLIVTPCYCSQQLVTTVILVLYRLHQIFKSYSDPSEIRSTVLSVLAEGVILIHTLARTDKAFAQRHAAVQLHYIRLLSGITFVMRGERDKWEFHLSALEELYDLEPDTGDLSQESEGEDGMDQS